MIVINKTTGKTIFSSIVKAADFSSRSAGLIPRRSLGAEDGMWINPCAMIHTCFMKFAIDVVFLDKGFYVVRVLENIRPWRFSPWVFDAHSVLEVSAGTAKEKVSVGDNLVFQ